ncbi:conserved hypothetical protein [Talaromyces stipitatus ATCC 10500]|uniref:Rhodopsin domain-containing protein n=1 Tax=Talaromyces stipitatus (strain ATCC 10500 / CBS 375.48 / QM 6759 / NRRL 1006) TaxID=441959 RepID=B8MDI7_TALSN|nr:uncharacterized protein TSTA_117350 [Talaromyces stipitatus ATCC 10500]EED17950.1 conserved hypothetical protein [Talaromyces stipitatus ATCC 10500]
MDLKGDTEETLILVGVFGVLTIGLMALRLFMRKFRQQAFTLSDYLTMVCVVFIFARSAFTTVVLLWGNNNMKRPNPGLSSTEIHRREIGSKLTLVNRAVYNTYLWIQKAVVLLLCERILAGLPWPERIVKFYWAVLFGSLVAVQVTTFAECKPFRLYWQVMPDPGTCIKANVQLITLVSLNITTDAMLILLPMPWLLRIKRSWLQRLQLVGLFSIGFLLIAIAIVRLPYYAESTAQVNRNTWGSVEQFFAAFVANVPTLFTLRRKKEDNTTIPSYPSALASGGRSTRSGFRQFDDTILVTDSIQLEYSSQERDRKPDSKFPRQTSDENLIRNDNDLGGWKKSG